MIVCFLQPSKKKKSNFYVPIGSGPQNLLIKKEEEGGGERRREREKKKSRTACIMKNKQKTHEEAGSVCMLRISGCSGKENGDGVRSGKQIPFFFFF